MPNESTCRYVALGDRITTEGTPATPASAKPTAGATAAATQGEPSRCRGCIGSDASSDISSISSLSDVCLTVEPNSIFSCNSNSDSPVHYGSRGSGDLGRRRHSHSSNSSSSQRTRATSSLPQGRDDEGTERCSKSSWVSLLLLCLAGVGPHLFRHALSAAELLLLQLRSLQYSQEVHGTVLGCLDAGGLAAAPVAAVLYRSPKAAPRALFVATAAAWIAQLCVAAAFAENSLILAGAAAAAAGLGGGVVVVLQRAIAAFFFPTWTAAAMAAAVCGTTIAKLMGRLLPLAAETTAVYVNRSSSSKYVGPSSSDQHYGEDGVETLALRLLLLILAALNGAPVIAAALLLAPSSKNRQQHQQQQQQRELLLHAATGSYVPPRLELVQADQTVISRPCKHAGRAAAAAESAAAAPETTDRSAPGTGAPAASSESGAKTLLPSEGAGALDAARQRQAREGLLQLWSSSCSIQSSAEPCTTACLEGADSQNLSKSYPRPAAAAAAAAAERTTKMRPDSKWAFSSSHTTHDYAVLKAAGSMGALPRAAVHSAPSALHSCSDRSRSSNRHSSSEGLTQHQGAELPRADSQYVVHVLTVEKTQHDEQQRCQDEHNEEYSNTTGASQKNHQRCNESPDSRNNFVRSAATGAAASHADEAPAVAPFPEGATSPSSSSCNLCSSSSSLCSSVCHSNNHKSGTGLVKTTELVPAKGRARSDSSCSSSSNGYSSCCSAPVRVSDELRCSNNSPNSVNSRSSNNSSNSGTTSNRINSNAKRHSFASGDRSAAAAAAAAAAAPVEEPAKTESRSSQTSLSLPTKDSPAMQLLLRKFSTSHYCTDATEPSQGATLPEQLQQQGVKRQQDGQRILGHNKQSVEKQSRPSTPMLAAVRMGERLTSVPTNAAGAATRRRCARRGCPRCCSGVRTTWRRLSCWTRGLSREFWALAAVHALLLAALHCFMAFASSIFFSVYQATALKAIFLGAVVTLTTVFLLPLVAVAVDRLGGSLPLLLGATLLVSLAFLGTISLQQQQHQNHELQLHEHQPAMPLQEHPNAVVPQQMFRAAVASLFTPAAADLRSDISGAASAISGLGVGNLGRSSGNANEAQVAANCQSWGITTALLLGAAEAITPPVLLAAIAHSVRRTPSALGVAFAIVEASKSIAVGSTISSFGFIVTRTGSTTAFTTPASCSLSVFLSFRFIYYGSLASSEFGRHISATTADVDKLEKTW
ncbi:hypothetical protein, conserved [Eimeria necatrix]|uniref:Uncharacterized protein n=1 Tax=Eimeria necatrix TaxID=51315 RepID=U6N365_9EIME|nr:hypothetical protein, conserved [Eimeria necatrix]CDJ69174.1 hypothetical protein, conserved [Eimeria necatrix]